MEGIRRRKRSRLIKVHSTNFFKRAVIDIDLALILMKESKLLNDTCFLFQHKGEEKVREVEPLQLFNQKNYELGL